MVKRAPCPALRPFLEVLWASSDTTQSQISVNRQLVLPTGMAHIILRLGESPVRILKNTNDQKGISIGPSIIGGVRATPYCKEFETLSPAVGMLLRPGALELMSGAPVSAFAGTHTRLDSVWGTSTLAEIVERLTHARTPSLRLDIVEGFLMRRFPPVRGIHPAIAHALTQFTSGKKIADVVSETGLSHRHFIKVFEATVGLTPKRYRRVQRFNHVLNVNKTYPAHCLTQECSRTVEPLPHENVPFGMVDQIAGFGTPTSRIGGQF